MGGFYKANLVIVDAHAGREAGVTAAKGVALAVPGQAEAADWAVWLHAALAVCKEHRLILRSRRGGSTPAMPDCRGLEQRDCPARLLVLEHRTATLSLTLVSWMESQWNTNNAVSDGAHHWF